MEGQSCLEDTVSCGHNVNVVQALKVIFMFICFICCTWSDSIFILSLSYYVWIERKGRYALQWNRM